MKYLLLLYDDAAAVAAASVDDRRTMVAEHLAYASMLRERGALVTSEPLDDSSSARTIRFSPGSDPVVTDGPFLETKEALGGFYVLEAGSIEEAAELARPIPRSPGLVAEIRPIVDM